MAEKLTATKGSRGQQTSRETVARYEIPVATHPSPGVNLIGFLQAEQGLGEVARKLGAALERVETPFSTISYRRTASRQEHPLEQLGSAEALYDTNILCLNGDQLRRFAEDVGIEFFAGRYSIGVWFWETTILPAKHLEGARFVDEVWVASEFVRRAVSAETAIPVLVAPLPIDTPPEPTRSRDELGLPPGFVFLFSFDFLSVFERKNPLALVEAFTRTFAPGEGPVLVLKSINGHRKPAALERLKNAARGRQDIYVLDGYVSSDERYAMMAACDCYVSLHRSEGFGLTIAEAMSYGRPVIATGYSGNMELMNEDNSYLVPFQLDRIPDNWSFSPGAEWANPDVDAAARLMRYVYEHQDDARALGQHAREEILRRFSLGRTAAFIDGRLREIRGRRTLTETSRDDIKTQLLRAAIEVGKGVGGGLTESAGGRAPTSLARRLLRRALWPFLAEQHRVNSALLDAVAVLQRSRDDALERLAQLEASRRVPTRQFDTGERGSPTGSGDRGPRAS